MVITTQNKQCTREIWSNIQRRHGNNETNRQAASSYPVDDFGFEGADDAAVVEDRMLFIQLFERRGRLRGEDRCLPQNPPLSGITGPTRDGGHPSV